jgi:hypothetical protein
MKRLCYLTFWILSLALCGWLGWQEGRKSGREERRHNVSITPPPATASVPPATVAAPAKGMAAVVAKVSAAAEMAPDSEEFANAVRDVLREPDSRRRMAAWYALLENLTPAHMAAIVPLIRENDLRGPGSGSEWAMMWEVWAAKDGAGAMNFLQQHDWTGWSRLSRPGARYNAMIGWGRGNPAAGAAWLQQPGNHQDDLERALLVGWSNKNPEAAAAWAFNNNVDQGNVDSIFGEMCRRGGAEQLEKWFQQQPADSVYMEKAAGALASAKIRNDPAAAAEWLVQNENQPWMAGGDILREKTQELAGKDPALAMQMAQSVSDPHAAGFAMLTWCDKDIHAASEWMKANPNAPHYDSAAAQLAAKLKSEDPEAARAWAGTIRDAARRAAALSAIPESN